MLVPVFFASTVFSADADNCQWQRGARLSVQDCRNQSLTPEVAREIERHRAKMPSSRGKYISISESDIKDSSEMPESVKQSISGGAYINAANEHGNTVLHLICNAQNMNLALQFIEYGAKLLPNNTGIRPQDLISNEYLAFVSVDCTDQEIEILRAFLVEEERKYSVPSFAKFPYNKKNGKRK